LRTRPLATGYLADMVDGRPLIERMLETNMLPALQPGRSCHDGESASGPDKISKKFSGCKGELFRGELQPFRVVIEKVL
jgi:hypothetical protein